MSYCRTCVTDVVRRTQTNKRKQCAMSVKLRYIEQWEIVIFCLEVLICWQKRKWSLLFHINGPILAWPLRRCAMRAHFYPFLSECCWAFTVWWDKLNQQVTQSAMVLGGTVQQWETSCWWRRVVRCCSLLVAAGSRWGLVWDFIIKECKPVMLCAFWFPDDSFCRLSFTFHSPSRRSPDVPYG